MARLERSAYPAAGGPEVWWNQDEIVCPAVGVVLDRAVAASTLVDCPLVAWLNASEAYLTGTESAHFSFGRRCRLVPST